MNIKDARQWSWGSPDGQVKYTDEGREQWHSGNKDPLSKIKTLLHATDKGMDAVLKEALKQLKQAVQFHGMSSSEASQHTSSRATEHLAQHSL